MTVSVWTEAMHERLRELTAEGETLSYEAVADRMNLEFSTRLSRNACIGKARRLGISKRPAPSFAKPAPEPPRMPKFVFKTPALAPAGPRNGRKTILELRRSNCRFAYGDYAPYLFCGRLTGRGSSYCDEHHKIIYARPGSARR